ncbi:AraC family transcriptional regulator [Cerasicoccus fimbriatus]|uniref:AraC family transcriptional regulator n=1 Tax=Cerasicoccus fimbriatus TaxID=3014554 RepID=UPI0022B4CC5A|nr:AraC family transcriptional regulator [Cerasicoccus sp. TK19100]
MPQISHSRKLRERLHLDRSLKGKSWLYQAERPFAPKPSHIHVELELNLCIAGQGEYLSEGRLIPLKPGGLIWLFPEQDHAMHRATPDFQMWIAIFRPSLLRQTCRQPENRPLLSAHRPATHQTVAHLLPTETQALVNLFSEIETLADAGQFDRSNAALPLLLLDAWQHTQSASAQQPAEDALHPAVFRAAMQINDDPTIESLTSLSAHAGLSYEHLSRIFSQQLGQTMSAYRNEQRLRRFATLIEGERFNLTEAALEAGFGSYTQCFRVLRDQWGLSPSQLKASPRNRHKKAAD